jgi:hypothetical protein
VCVTLTPAYTTAVFPKRIWWQMFRDAIPRLELTDFRRVTFYPNVGSEVAMRYRLRMISRNLVQSILLICSYNASNEQIN